MVHKPDQAKEILKHIDFEPEWFIDCGVGEGVEAQVFKQRWPGVNVIGFEPSMIGFSAIKDFPGKLIQKAVWFEDGERVFTERATQMQSGFFRLPDHAALGESSRWVETVKLDSVISHEKKNVVLWLDIEWSEIFALVGAVNSLRRGAVRVINVEAWGATAAILRGFLEPLGFGNVMSYEKEGGHWDEVWRLKG